MSGRAAGAGARRGRMQCVALATRCPRALPLATQVGFPPFATLQVCLPRRAVAGLRVRPRRRPSQVEGSAGWRRGEGGRPVDVQERPGWGASTGACARRCCPAGRREWVGWYGVRQAAHALAHARVMELLRSPAQPPCTSHAFTRSPVCPPCNRLRPSRPRIRSPASQIKYVKGIDLSPAEVKEAERRYSELKARDRGEAAAAVAGDVWGRPALRSVRVRGMQRAGVRFMQQTPAQSRGRVDGSRAPRGRRGRFANRAARRPMPSPRPRRHDARVRL